MYKITMSDESRTEMSGEEFYEVERLHRLWVKSDMKEGRQADLSFRTLFEMPTETKNDVCLYGANLNGAHIYNDLPHVNIDVRCANRLMMESFAPFVLFTAGKIECQILAHGVVLIGDLSIAATMIRDAEFKYVVDNFGLDVAMARKSIIFALASKGFCRYPRAGEDSDWSKKLDHYMNYELK